MKKSLIALAVAGALAAPMVAQADATLYGSLRLKVVAEDGQDLNVDDNTSRVGIRGSVDTNIDGVKAIYTAEWGVDTADDGSNFTGRLGYVGLTGGFGTATIGQQWTPEYSFVTGAVDILDGNSTAQTVNLGRSGNVIAYVTPNMGGFQAALGVVADNDAEAAAAKAATAVKAAVPAKAAARNGEDADSYHVAAKYAVADFTVAASYIDDQSAADADRTAVAATYAADALYVAFLYQDREGMDNAYELAGSYAFGDTKLLANYAILDDDGKAYGIEVQQSLGKQARLFANYLELNDDAETATSGDTFSAGLRVDF